MKTNLNGALQNIIEKPDPEQIEDFKDAMGKLRVSMNIFKFHGADFYPYLQACPPHPIRDEKELPTALLNMVKDHPGAAMTYPVSEAVPDLTAKEDIPMFRKFLEENYLDH